MGRKRTKRSSVVKSEPVSCNTSVSSLASVRSSTELNDTLRDKWLDEMEDKCESVIAKFNKRRQKFIDKLEDVLHQKLLQMPKNFQTSEVHMDDINIIEAMCGNICDDVDSSESETNPSEHKSRRQRSNSVVIEEFVKPEAPKQRRTRVRSTSVDVYQTPRNRVRVSTLTSAKKYTVSKPSKTEESGINMKRIMRPDEEAISTSGSPLYVHSGVTSTPHVNIPLPGGVVMSIEPKRPRGRLDVPELDEHTKKQIKILCAQLQSIADS